MLYHIIILSFKIQGFCICDTDYLINPLSVLYGSIAHPLWNSSDFFRFRILINAYLNTRFLWPRNLFCICH